MKNKKLFAVLMALALVFTQFPGQRARCLHSADFQGFSASVLAGRQARRREGRC